MGHAGKAVHRIDDLEDSAFKTAQRDGHAVGKHITELYKQGFHRQRQTDAQDSSADTQLRAEHTTHLQDDPLAVFHQRTKQDTRTYDAADDNGNARADLVEAEDADADPCKNQLA